MPEKAQTLTFKVRGMDCAEEVAVLKREVGPIAGGEERLTFDLLNARMSVRPSGEQVTSLSVMEAVARAGLTAEVWQEHSTSEVEASFWQRHGRNLVSAVSGLFALLGFCVHAAIAGGVGAAFGSEGLGIEGDVPLTSRALYLASIVAGTWFVLPKAWLAARRLRPDMNLLMIVAIIGAVVIGEWFEGATVAFLFSLSLALEAWSVGRARRAVQELMNMTPPVARILHPDGREEELPLDQVAVGSIILVKPGERFALDGTVKRGQSQVNQAPITGESVPVSKGPNDAVFAGTINEDGVLEVQTTKATGDTSLANIIRMIGDAQTKRSVSEQWVDKFATIYTPIVMALALATFLIPPLLFAQEWHAWFYRALVLLVIACPCALVISTPVSIVAAIAAAARNGILIKGGIHIETPARLKCLAFDKTGTLTEGKPTVVAVVALDDHTENELLERAASLESQSTHPLAKAIMEYAHSKNIAFEPASDAKNLPGKGSLGTVKGKAFWLGSHRYLEERKQETPEVHARLESMAQAGQSVVIIGNDSHVCGFIALADRLRPNTKKALNALRSAGIEQLVMLSGDNKPTAQAIAQQAGIKDVHAELMPEDKVKTVESLVARFGVVGMVGDGINDAPALARANLGIAMGAFGSDAAIETADVALMSDDLSKIAWLVHHSRQTLSIIRQNIYFALTVKAVFAILTFAGYAHIWAAIAADMGASLLVIFNGLRLLKK